ncbi:MAG: hypothetical protein AB7L66_11325 [Gemmatimonadales bacterium]
MGNNPLVKSVLGGTVLQVLMVALGKLLPTIGGNPNFFPIAGTALAAIAGFLFNRNAPGASAGRTATGGAAAGGISSILGGLAAVGTGQWPDFAALQLLFPALSGGVGGVVGAFLGRMLKGKPAA